MPLCYMNHISLTKKASGYKQALIVKTGLAKIVFAGIKMVFARIVIKINSCYAMFFSTLCLKKTVPTYILLLVCQI